MILAGLIVIGLLLLLGPHLSKKCCHSESTLLDCLETLLWGDLAVLLLPESFLASFTSSLATTFASLHTPLHEPIAATVAATDLVPGLGHFEPALVGSHLQAELAEQAELAGLAGLAELDELAELEELFIVFYVGPLLLSLCYKSLNY